MAPPRSFYFDEHAIPTSHRPSLSVTPPALQRFRSSMSVASPTSSSSSADTVMLADYTTAANNTTTDVKQRMMSAASAADPRSASSSDAEVDDHHTNPLHTATTSSDEWSSHHDSDMEEQHQTLSTHKLKRRRRQMHRTQRKQQRHAERESQRTVKRMYRRSSKSEAAELAEVTQRMQLLVDNQSDIQKRIAQLQAENSQLRQLTQQARTTPITATPASSSPSPAPPLTPLPLPEILSTSTHRPAAFSGVVESIMNKFRAMSNTNKSMSKLWEWCRLLGTVRIKQVLYVISTICLLYMTAKLNDATNIVSNIAAEHNARAHAAAALPPTVDALPAWMHMDYSQFTLHHMQRRRSVTQQVHPAQDQRVQQAPVILPVALPHHPAHTVDTVMSASSASQQLMQRTQAHVRAARMSVLAQYRAIPSLQQLTTAPSPDPFSLDTYFSASTASTIRNVMQRAINFGDRLCSKSFITSVASLLAIIWYCLSNTYAAMQR